MRADREVLLVDTSLPGSRGSMERYARLVGCAIESQAATAVWKPTTLNVAFPWGFPGWLPGALQTWLNHFWIVATAGRRINQSGAELIHVLDGSHGYVVHGVSNKPVVTTIHDLIPLKQQEPHVGRNVSFAARHFINRSVTAYAKCKHLLAVSGSTKEDLSALLSIAEKDVTVVLNALDNSFAAQAPAKTRRRDELIILHVGNNAWYKNRAGVVRIFARLRQQVAARLVLAGPPPDAKLKALIREQGLSAAVTVIESPNDEQLIELYRGASLFLFPSLYEGFGWPPLEAMALGCPVVCSSAASLPEVVGEAALMAPAEDEQQLADHCLSVLNDKALAHILSEKGRLRAGQFTPERMGREMVEIYNRATETHASSG